MTFAAYSLGDAILSILFFFLLFIWIWLLIVVFGDIFRSHDLNGVAKVLWLIFIIVLPYLGVFLYLILRGDKMAEHAAAAAKAQDDAMRAYVQQAAGGGTADELAKLAELKANGTISEDDYNAAKAKVLGG